MASSAPSTSSIHFLPADAQQRKLLAWGLAATAACAAGAGVWWLTREHYYSYVPLQYQYRPGTFTAWISKVLARHAKRRRSRRPIRVYMDGCFDLMHYGHANALRQAKTLGDELVVGLVPDSEILRCKGPPLLNEEERLEMVESVKWVDEVLTGVPYDLTPDFLHELFYKHKIDYVIHGDDPCLMPDGTDAYAYAKEAGRFRMIKRTEGVSTTDIVGRMLMCSRVNAASFSEEHSELAREFSRGQERDGGGGGGGGSDMKTNANDDDGVSVSLYSDEEDEDDAPNATTPAAAAVVGSPPMTARLLLSRQGSLGPARRPTGGSAPPAPVRVSHFMPTSRRIVQFSSGKSPPQGGKVVYIDGAFDLFHVGHIDILKAAREQGNFLLVGIHTDEDVSARRGAHLPILGLHERALSVLACRYADEVIIGAPQVITEDLLTTFGIGLVVRGTVHEAPTRAAASEEDRYAVPKEKGMLCMLPSPSKMTSKTLIQRIVQNRAQFEARQAKKVQSEEAYYGAAKQYIDEV